MQESLCEVVSLIPFGIHGTAAYACIIFITLAHNARVQTRYRILIRWTRFLVQYLTIGSTYGDAMFAALGAQKSAVVKLGPAQHVLHRYHRSRSLMIKMQKSQ